MTTVRVRHPDETLLAKAAPDREIRLLRLLSRSASILLQDQQYSGLLEKLFQVIKLEFSLDVFLTYRLTDSGTLCLAASYGLTRDQKATLCELEVGQHVCGTVARTGAPFHAERVQQSDDPLVSALKDLGLGAYLCQPLLEGDKVIGTLAVGSKSKLRFEEDEVEFLRTVGSYVALAKHRVRKERELKTALKQKEDALRIRSKLEAEVLYLARQSALGAVSMTIAHELSQPLSAASNYLAAASFQIVGGMADEARHSVECGANQISRAGEIIRAVRNLVRGGTPRREDIDLETLVGEVLRLMEAAGALTGLDTHLDLSEDARWIHGDPVQLGQVLVNLIQNAADAMSECRERELSICSHKVAEGVQVCVTDTGAGLPPEKIEHLLECAPSGLTADRLGVGLAIARSLIEAHGGHICFKAAQPRGMTVCFTAPVASRVQ